MWLRERTSGIRLTVLIPDDPAPYAFDYPVIVERHNGGCGDVCLCVKRLCVCLSLQISRLTFRSNYLSGEGPSDTECTALNPL